MVKSKKGLSPVIATSLLIAIAVVLALIIFLWAKSFVGEVVKKDLGGGPEPIENACGEIQFTADATTSSINVENQGNVPLYGVDVKKVGVGSVESKQVLNKTISAGETLSAGIPSGISSGDQIEVIPIIVGETSNSKRQYSCTNNAITITVE